MLEHQLVMYVTSSGRDNFSTPFDLSSVPIVTREQAHAEERTKKLTTALPTLKAPSTGPKKTDAARSTQGSAESIAAATAAAQKYSAALQAVPEIAAYGQVLKSSPVVELTESETEYVVTAIKHVFAGAIVLQFDVKNTLPATVLLDVSIVCVPQDEEGQLEEDFIVPIPRLDTDVPGTAYVVFKRTDDSAVAVAASFTNILKFTSKEIDPATNEPEEGDGYEDEYQVEDLDLTGADFVVPAYAGNFDTVFAEISAAGGDEATETLQLSAVKSLPDATESLIKALGMQPLEGSETPSNNSTHVLKVLGKSVKGGKVAGLVRMAYSAKSGVTVKIVVRSEEDGIAGLVVAAVA